MYIEYICIVTEPCTYLSMYFMYLFSLPHTVRMFVVVPFNTVIHEVKVKVVVVSIAVLMISSSVKLTVTHSVMFSCTTMIDSIFETDTVGGDTTDTLALIDSLVSYTSNVVATYTTRGYMFVAS